MENNLGISMGSVPMGTIIAWMGSFKNIPSNWFLCDGSPIPQGYPKLKIALSPMATLPDLVGITIVGASSPKNSTSYNYQSTGGEETHLLTESEMPAHTHQSPSNDSGNPAGNGNSVYGTDRGQDGVYPFTTGSAGGSQPHNNMQPYIALYYLIYAGKPA